MPSKSPFTGALKFLYTQNPFYLISTCLVLYGIHEAFHPESGDYIDPWALMSSLCGYTLLLSVTTFLIIKFGKVWDDARSIVLILSLLILVVSVSFDEIVNLNPASGRKLLLFGFCFAVAITEGLLRGLGIQLRAYFRIPYYLILSLFFAYPLFVSPEVTELSREVIRFRIFLFPSLAGLCFLGLLPAVRRGAKFVRENGTPWKWPWFPWAMFGVLAFGVCLRSYVLSVSFEPSSGYGSIFQGYFLVPFAFAGLLLLMEIGIKERLPQLLNTVSLMAPFVFLLSIPFEIGDEIADDFLASFVETIGSPLFLTLCGLCLFYLFAWFRKLPGAEWGFVVSLLGLTVIGPQTVTMETLAEPQLWPLAIAGVVELIHSIIRRDSRRCFIGSVSCLVAMMIVLQKSSLLPYPIEVGYHLFLAVILVIGAAFQDEFAMILRGMAVLLLPLTGLVVLFSVGDFSISETLRWAYLSALIVVTLGYGWLVNERMFLFAGLLMLTTGSLKVGWAGYLALERSIGPRAPASLIWGIVCFVIATLISAWKGGLGRKLPR